MTEPDGNEAASSRSKEPGSGDESFPVVAGQLESASESFEDPAVYQSFVRSLYARVEDKLNASLDPDIESEIAALIWLLTVMPPEVVQQNRVFFVMAFDLLQAAKPDALLLKSIRRNLSAINDRYMGGISRLLLIVSGKTLLNAVLSGILTILLMPFAYMLIMSGALKLLFLAAHGAQMDVRLLSVLKGQEFNELMLMGHAAFLGTIVSIMVRIRTFLSDTTITPLTMYVSVAMRPVVSVLVAALAFCTIKSGMISFHGIELDGPNGYYVAWGIGFLCGFSERLAQNFIVGASSSLVISKPSTAKASPPPS